LIEQNTSKRYRRFVIKSRQTIDNLGRYIPTKRNLEKQKTSLRAARHLRWPCIGTHSPMYQKHNIAQNRLRLAPSSVSLFDVALLIQLNWQADII